MLSPIDASLVWDFFAIILADIVLSGDNAIIIRMAVLSLFR